MMHRGDVPFGFFRRHAVFVDKHTVHPDRCGLHPAEKADLLPVQICRSIDVRIFTNKNEAMTKHARGKNRNRDKVGFVPRSIVDQFAKRHLGNVVLSSEHARKHARHILCLNDFEFEPGNSQLTAQDRQNAVIGAAREFNFAWRAHALSSAQTTSKRQKREC